MIGYHARYTGRGLARLAARCERAAVCPKLADFGSLEHHGMGKRRPPTPVASSHVYNLSFPHHATWWVLQAAELRAHAFGLTLARGGGTFPPVPPVVRLVLHADMPSGAGLMAAMSLEVRAALW